LRQHVADIAAQPVVEGVETVTVNHVDLLLAVLPVVEMGSVQCLVRSLGKRATDDCLGLSLQSSVILKAQSEDGL
jgi:phosphoribulokinase